MKEFSFFLLFIVSMYVLLTHILYVIQGAAKVPRNLFFTKNTNTIFKFEMRIY